MCLWQQSDDGTQFFLAPLFYYIETKNETVVGLLVRRAMSPGLESPPPTIVSHPVSFSVSTLGRRQRSEEKRREGNLKMPVWLMGDGW